MKAREIMTAAVTTVRPNTPVRVAAALLTDQGFASLPVLDDEDRLVGIVSVMDVIGDRMPADARVASRPRPPENDPAREVRHVMTTTVLSLRADADTADLAALMMSSNIRAVPIVEDSRLVGIASRHDLLRTLVRADAAIRTDVLDRITDYTGVSDGWVLDVDSGIVTIRGRFTDTAREAIIVQLARTVPGVLRVHAQDTGT